MNDITDETKATRLTDALRHIADYPAVLDEHQPTVTDLVLHHWETVCELKRIAGEALKEQPVLRSRPLTSDDFPPHLD